jgi:hypothetical protein
MMFLRRCLSIMWNKKQTSKWVASEASAELKDKAAPKMAKSIAGSALGQTPFHKVILARRVPKK